MHKEFVTEFVKYKKLGQQTLAQVTDEALNHIPGTEANSIAMIVCHLHGNLLSRFTDFLTTDGEKLWRNRAAEFAEIHYTREAVERLWAAGWAQLEMALSALDDNDLQRIVAIKGTPMTVDGALCRALAHVAYHVGQMVLLGRMASAGQWQYLSTPR